MRTSTRTATALAALPLLAASLALLTLGAPATSHAASNRIVHVASDKCIHPYQRVWALNQRLVVNGGDCDNSSARFLDFIVDRNAKRIRHPVSDFCMMPKPLEEGKQWKVDGVPDDNTEVVLGQCDDPLAEFVFENRRFLKHVSGKCVHIAVDEWLGQNQLDLRDDAVLVMHRGCRGERNTFTVRTAGAKKTPLDALNTILLHSVSGSCALPEGGRTRNNTTIVLQAYGCDLPEKRMIFGMLPNGAIVHKDTGKCLHPHGGSINPGNNTRLVLHDGCKRNGILFRVNDNSTIEHRSSGKCIHPSGGDWFPRDGSGLVLHNGCDEGRRIEFEFYQN